MSNDGGWRGYEQDSWREAEFGHGQERYYGELGQQSADGPPPGPAPHRPPSAPVDPVPSNGRPPWLGLGAAVTVVALAAGGGYLAFRPDSTVTPASTATPATTPSSQAAPEASITRGTPASAVPTLMKPGWQLNTGDPTRERAVFEVPPAGTFTSETGQKLPAWKVEPKPTMLYGLAHPKTKLPIVLGHRPSLFLEGFCAADKDDSLGMFVWHVSQSDPADAVNAVGPKWVEGLALKKDGSKETAAAATVQQVMVNGGKTPAAQWRTTVPHTDNDPKNCGVTQTEVVATAFTANGKTAVLVVLRSLGHPKSMPETRVQQILSTLRPL